MGKYSKITPSLPKMPAEDAAYQEKVNAVKDWWLKNNPREASAMAEEFGRLRRRKKRWEEREKKLNMRIAAIEQLLVEQYEVEGISGLKLVDGSSVRVQTEPYGQIVDRDALRVWAIANGLERSLMLPWQTVNAITKQNLLDGNPEPEGVKAHAMDKVVFTKG